jgi:hypothetical protein
MAEDALRDKRCGTDESKRTASFDSHGRPPSWPENSRHLRTKAHAARNGAKFHGRATARRRAGSAASQTQRGDNFSLDMILMTDA